MANENAKTTLIKIDDVLVAVPADEYAADPTATTEKYGELVRNDPQVQARKEREQRARAKFEERRAKVAEERDRQEFERLSAKFNGGDNPNG